MPAKCPFCVNGTHSDHDIKEYPVCTRKFMTPSEAWAVTGEDKKDRDIHVFSNPNGGMLIGCDWGRDAIKELFNNCRHIEMCDPKGTARSMKHGIAVLDKDNHQWFIETDEDLLKAYEELYCNGE